MYCCRELCMAGRGWGSFGGVQGVQPAARAARKISWSAGSRERAQVCWRSAAALERAQTQQDDVAAGEIFNWKRLIMCTLSGLAHEPVMRKVVARKGSYRGEEHLFRTQGVASRCVDPGAVFPSRGDRAESLGRALSSAGVDLAAQPEDGSAGAHVTLDARAQLCDGGTRGGRALGKARSWCFAVAGWMARCLGKLWAQSGVSLSCGA